MFIAIAGLLHDVVEDTGVSLKRIENMFGKKVANIVQGCSEPDMKDTWKNRKKHTIHYLETAPIDTLLVACADKTNNI